MSPGKCPLGLQPLSPNSRGPPQGLSVAVTEGKAGRSEGRPPAPSSLPLSQPWGGLPALSSAVLGSDHVEVPHLSGTGILAVTLLGLGLCLEGKLVETPQVGCCHSACWRKEHIPAFLGTGGRWQSRCEEGQPAGTEEGWRAALSCLLPLSPLTAFSCSPGRQPSLSPFPWEFSAAAATPDLWAAASSSQAFLLGLHGDMMSFLLRQD